MATNTVQWGKQSWDNNAGAGQLREETWPRQPEKTVGTVQAGQERKDRIART
jgi:hypothetical protein